MTLEELENICMEIISKAGESRAQIYCALDLYLKGDCKAAREKIEETDVYLQEAHDVQFTKLMAYQLNGGEIPFQLLILHAMDLLMIVSSERDMLRHVVLAKCKE